MTGKKMLLLVLMSLIAVGGCGRCCPDSVDDSDQGQISGTTPVSGWAEPLTCEGVGNFYRVSPTLYRGEQPTKEGMENLSKMGIKMIVSLREYHGDSRLIGDLPLKYKRLKFNSWRPKDEQVSEFLKLVSDPENQPVFVHCLHGADRTGMMCAACRVAFDGWSKPEAIDEWTRGGFGFHKIFKDLVRYF
ncbi:MAG: dual specificity protein phosphatase family protein, partial [bacterium]|nr:dual specificity protein phosphatase family protein [bacterium]